MNMGREFEFRDKLYFSDKYQLVILVFTKIKCWILIKSVCGFFLFALYKSKYTIDAIKPNSNLKMNVFNLFFTFNLRGESFT